MIIANLSEVIKLTSDIGSETFIVPQVSNDPRPPYPFGTYTITSPYLNVKRFEQGEDIIEDAEIVVSLTWHSLDQLESIQLAQKFATLFNHSAIKQRLNSYGVWISIVRVEGFGSRDNFLSIKSEFRTGFDLRLRIRHKEEYPIEYIESFKI
jgi:hypothetical protein